MTNQLIQEYRRIEELIMHVRKKPTVSSVEKALLDEARKAITQAMEANRNES